MPRALLFVAQSLLFALALYAGALLWSVTP